MGVAPKWSALTDSEKLEAFQELSYVATKVALIAGQQQQGQSQYNVMDQNGNSSVITVTPHN